MRTLFLSFIVLFYSSSLFSQSEVFFTNTKRDSISIKSFSSIQFQYKYIGYNGLQPSLAYCKEVKISPTIGAIFMGEMRRGQALNAINEVITGADLALSVEPRWHINFKNRYLKGSNTLLNAGWSLGLPMQLSAMVFRPDMPILFNAKIAPTINYRYAFSKKFYSEFSVGRAFNSSPLYKYDNLHIGLKAAYVFK